MDGSWQSWHLRIALTSVVVVGCLVCVPAARAHLEEEQGPPVGEYRVTLDSLTISPGTNAGHAKKKFALQRDDPITLFIHTQVQAETHTLQDAIFEKHARVGHPVGLGRLIYWHVDCVRGEDLNTIVHVAVVGDHKLGQPVRGLLGKDGGIVTDEDGDRPAEFPPAPGSQGRIQNDIASEEANLTPLPTYFTDPPFIISPNAGTGTFAPRIKNGATGEITPVPGDEASYEFTATYTYKPLDFVCFRNERRAAISRQASKDPQVRRILELTTDDGAGYTKGETKACGVHRRANKGGSARPARRHARRNRRSRCRRVRRGHRRPPSPPSGPPLSGKGSFTSVDPTTVGYSISFNQLTTGFKLVVPGRQLVPGPQPPGFSCSVSGGSSNSTYMCTGNHVAKVPVQGLLQTFPPPNPGMGGQLFGFQGTTLLGPFQIAGP